MKKMRRNRFTLIELLAAMAVFSVLLLVAMQLFSGIQRVWVRAEQKTNSFADSRAAMEFMAARLQTLVYYSVKLDDNSEDKVPFGLTPNSDAGVVYFMTAMPMNRRKDNKEIDTFKGFRFLRFKLDTNTGELKMDIASSHRGQNSARNFQFLAPPYETGKYSSTPTESQIFSSEFFDADDDSVTIVNNVTAFKLVPYKDDLSENSETSKQEQPPKMLRIELSIIDNKDKFDDWKSANTDDEKKAIQEEYGYTFQRIVVLGK